MKARDESNGHAETRDHEERDEGAGKAKGTARILVVNDTQEILELFQALLEEEGYQVFLYSFVPHDLSEVQRIQPDLVILDLVFGAEKLGWQLLDKIRMSRATAKIPVIVCTAAHNEARLNDGYLKAMGVLVILKPFDIDRMLAAVKDALESPPPAVSS